MADNEIKDPNDLTTTIAAINKAYGTKTEAGITYFGGTHITPNEIIPTGLISLDLAVGNGGLATGSIMEVYGPESSGKTTMALFIMAEAQKLGHNVAFIDMEHALDRDLAEAYGIDTKKVLFKQPDCGEEALGIVEMLVESGKVKVIVVDSVDALVPRSVLEGDFQDSNMGKQAKMMSQAMRKLSPAVEKNKVLLIFINQIRMKIGVMFGSPETTSGGNALKFYSKYRLDVRSRDKIKEGDVIVGSKINVKVKKNKKAPPFREAMFSLIYGKGFDKYQELADTAKALGLVTMSGAWAYLGEEKVGQGIKSVVVKCKEDGEFYNRLTEMVYKNLEDK